MGLPILTVGFEKVKSITSIAKGYLTNIQPTNPYSKHGLGKECEEKDKSTREEIHRGMSTCHVATRSGLLSLKEGIEILDTEDRAEAGASIQGISDTNDLSPSCPPR